MRHQSNETTEQDKRLEQNIGRIKNSIIVLSGKGGVGKSTVAVNTAWALADKGHKTGILDIDIHGPNIAKMFGIEGCRLKGSEHCITPCQVAPDLTAMSIALMNKDPDTPIVWRGPLKTAAIKQFISDVDWGSLDYLVIDAPPGTGDEALSACGFLKKVTAAVIVTTPQDVAILDSRKTVQFARKLGIPVAGIIENMSGFVCAHCGKTTDLFKRGGGEEAAQSLDVPFLGRIPIEPAIVTNGDNGTPFVRVKDNTTAVISFDAIVKNIQGALDGENL